MVSKDRASASTVIKACDTTSIEVSLQIPCLLDKGTFRETIGIPIGMLRCRS